MSIILKYKEWLTISPCDARWVYDVCSSMPKYDKINQVVEFEKTPKRIEAREAKRIILEEGLDCVFSNEYGKIYA